MGTQLYFATVCGSTDTKKNCSRRGSTPLPPACEADVLPLCNDAVCTQYDVESGSLNNINYCKI